MRRRPCARCSDGDQGRDAYQFLAAAEILVLQFLPGHLTFGQIGEHLFLSGNAVKTHALAVYRYHELGASTRHEAVTRARQLGPLGGAGAPRTHMPIRFG